MAGIGFRLKPLIQSDVPLQRLQGGAAAVVLSSGPWLLAIFAVTFVASTAMKKLAPSDQQLFRAMVNATYAFSFIVSSSFELVFNRWISDLIFVKENARVGDVHLFHLTLLLIGVSGLWGLVGLIAGLKIAALWAIMALASSSVWLWASASVVHAIKDYGTVLVRSLMGAVIAVGAAVLLGRTLKWGIPGFIYGLSLGQLFVAASLTFKILGEFGSQRRVQWREFKNILWRFRSYFAIGALVGVGLWVDKILFWIHPDTSEVIQSIWVKSSLYDVSVFSAYLSVVPAIAMFFVAIETKFFVALRNWIACCENHAPLSVIKEYRIEMIQGLRADTKGVLLFQCAFTLGYLVFSHPIARLLKMPVEFSSVLRMTAIGSLFYVLFIFVNLLLLYIEKTREAFFGHLIFVLLNATLTWISLQMGPAYYGMGYALAALLALFFSMHALRVRLNDLEERFFRERPW